MASLSRQHFVAFARLVYQGSASREARVVQAERMADYLTTTNPRFDRGRFIKAAVGGER